MELAEKAVAAVLASEAKQSSLSLFGNVGLLRRFAPRHDMEGLERRP